MDRTAHAAAPLLGLAALGSCSPWLLPKAEERTSILSLDAINGLPEAVVLTSILHQVGRTAHARASLLGTAATTSCAPQLKSFTPWLYSGSVTYNTPNIM